MDACKETSQGYFLIPNHHILDGNLSEKLINFDSIEVIYQKSLNTILEQLGIKYVTNSHGKFNYVRSRKFSSIYENDANNHILLRDKDYELNVNTPFKMSYFIFPYTVYQWKYQHLIQYYESQLAFCLDVQFICQSSKEDPANIPDNVIRISMNVKGYEIGYKPLGFKEIGIKNVKPSGANIIIDNFQKVDKEFNMNIFSPPHSVGDSINIIIEIMLDHYSFDIDHKTIGINRFE